MGQRPEAVEDLVEEILRMDLLHDLPVDPVSHAEHPIAVDAVNGVRTAPWRCARAGVDPPDRRDVPGGSARSRPTRRRAAARDAINMSR